MAVSFAGVVPANGEYAKRRYWKIIIGSGIRLRKNKN